MNTFTKPAIAVTQQIQLLKNRGLIFLDESRAILFLEAVSFFRLSPYMRPFQLIDDNQHNFKANIGFRKISRLYDFDHRLRLLVMDAIERIEIASRAHIINHLGPKYGAHWYLEQSRFKTNYNHARLLETLKEKQQSAQRDYQKECTRIDNVKNTDVTRKTIQKQRRAQESYARQRMYFGDEH